LVAISMRFAAECKRGPMHESTHRPFANTGLEIPRVVFGATVLGNLFVAMSDAAKRELIKEWFAQMPAPVAIDTAGKYGAGLSLEVIGRELAALDVDPSDVIISNKLAWRRVPLTTPEPMFEPGVWIDIEHDAVQEISYDGIMRCYDDGCRMLGDYRQQLISVHDPDEYLAAATGDADREQRLADITGAYRALSELRDQGRAAGVGVGAKDWRVIRELDQHCDFDWVMMANSFTIMNHPPELVEFIDSLAQRNVAVINSALMHGGFLVGGDFLDYRKIDPSDPGDAESLRWREQFVDVCRHHGQQPFDVAVAFGTSHPAITSVALSTSRPERVESMVRAATREMPAEVWASLREAGLIDPDYDSPSLWEGRA
jgi:D-threo-aldose 1-dehydrogenase